MAYTQHFIEGREVDPREWQQYQQSSKRKQDEDKARKEREGTIRVRGEK